MDANGKPDYTAGKKVEKAIQSHVGTGNGRPRKNGTTPATNPAIDKKTGLPAGQALTLEKLRTERTANDEREIALSNDYMKVEDHLTILRNLCLKLDQLPSRVKSETGCEQPVMLSIQKKLDDLRREFAEGLK